MPSSVGLNFCFHRLVDIVLSRDSSKVAARERLVGVKSLPMLEEEGNFLISCNFLSSWFFDFFYLWVTKILLKERRVYTFEWWVKIHYQLIRKKYASSLFVVWCYSTDINQITFDYCTYCLIMAIWMAEQGIQGGLTNFGN